jgi:hypothetical protein
LSIKVYNQTEIPDTLSALNGLTNIGNGSVYSEGSTASISWSYDAASISKTGSFLVSVTSGYYPSTTKAAVVSLVNGVGTVAWGAMTLVE